MGNWIRSQVVFQIGSKSDENGVPEGLWSSVWVSVSPVWPHSVPGSMFGVCLFGIVLGQESMNVVVLCLFFFLLFFLVVFVFPLLFF